MDDNAAAELGDTVEAVMMAIDNTLARIDPLTIEDLQTVEKLVRARSALQRDRSTER